MASAQRVTGPTPAGVGQPQNGGDERAGMADANPKNEIGDIEGPKHGPVQAPDADPMVDLPGEGEDAGQDHAARHSHGKPVPGAGAHERPQQVRANLFRCFSHCSSRWLAEDSLRWVSCRVRRAAWWIDRNGPGAKPRYSDRSESPKTMALGAQVCTQAGLNSPSFSSRFSPSA